MDNLPQYTAEATEAELPVDEPTPDQPPVYEKPNSGQEQTGGVVPYPLPITSAHPSPKSRRPTKHTFPFNSSLSLHLFSYATKCDSTPIFYTNNTVRGTVELVVKGGLLSSLHSISVRLRGVMRSVVGVSNKHRAAVFMSRYQTLWDSSLPRLPKGKVELPFSFAFPNICELWDSDVESPPSFRPPGYPCFFNYDLMCTVKYKSIKPNSELEIPIKYVPQKAAAPPSPARALAYEMRAAVPGPLEDPSGWMSQPIEVDMRAFGVRDVHISCVFSLAGPLEYARSAHIPYHLEVTCNDEQALDLLSHFSAFSVVLNRQVVLRDTVGQDDETPLDIVGRGRSWLIKEQNRSSSFTRCLEGEIKLSPQLMQGFSFFPYFSLRYAVHLRIDAAGLSPLDSRKDNARAWLLRVPIAITYLPHRDTPAPVSYAPPLRPGEKNETRYIQPVPPLLFASIESLDHPGFSESAGTD